MPTPIESGETPKVGPEKTFVFIGPPTSGKTNQAIWLSQKLPESTILRGRDVLPSQAEQLALKRQMIPDADFLPALSNALYFQSSKNLMLDNIPRTILQARVVVNWATDVGTNLVVVELVLSLDDVLYRSANRTACPHCGESYHPELKPSTLQGFCDRDGYELIKRVGDDPELIKMAYQRHVRFADQITQILEPVSEVHRISASGKVADVFLELFSKISGN